MTAHLRWIAGAEPLRSALEHWSSAPTPNLRADAGRHRTLHLLSDDPACDRIVKRFKFASGPHPVRDALKRGLRLDASRREWRALCALTQRGVPVPAPLGFAWSAGDALIVQARIDGPTLWDWLAEPEHGPQRRATLLRVAEAVGRMHAAGYVHGDLHPGNVMLGTEGPVLLDFQHSHRSRRVERDALPDLGLFDYGLAQRGVSRGDRLRFRSAALRAAGARVDRSSLRAIGASAERAARRHAATRQRHALRAHGRFRRVEVGGRPALVAPGWDAATVAALLAPGGASERGAHVESQGLGPSPLRVAGLRVGREHARLWLTAEALRVRDIRAATGVALLGAAEDASDAGSSTLVTRSAPLASLVPYADAAAVDALALLLARLHRRGVLRARLDEAHVRIGRDSAGRVQVELLRPGGLHFIDDVDPAAASRELDQFDAALAKAGVPDTLRERARTRYRRARMLSAHAAPLARQKADRDAPGAGRAQRAQSASGNARQAPPSTSS